MVLIFFCIFILTEQRGSPCYQTLEQYQVAGLGMVMMFFPLLSTNYQSRRVFRIWNHTKLIDLMWYYCFFAFLTSPSNESRLITRHYNNIKLLDFVCYWYSFSFFVTPLSESPCYQNSKQYKVAGLAVILIFFCIFNITEQWESPCYQTLQQYQVAGLGMVMMFFPLLSANYQSRRVFRVWNNTKLLDLVWYWFFCFFFHPIIRVAVLL